MDGAGGRWEEVRDRASHSGGATIVPSSSNFFSILKRYKFHEEHEQRKDLRRQLLWNPFGILRIILYCMLSMSFPIKQGGKNELRVSKGQVLVSGQDTSDFSHPLTTDY
jgi:hypothetical protein